MSKGWGRLEKKMISMHRFSSYSGSNNITKERGTLTSDQGREIKGWKYKSIRIENNGTIENVDNITIKNNT